MKEIRINSSGIIAILKAQQRVLVCAVVICCSVVFALPVSAAKSPTETIKPVFGTIQINTPYGQLSGTGQDH